MKELVAAFVYYKESMMDGENHVLRSRRITIWSFNVKALRMSSDIRLRGTICAN